MPFFEAHQLNFHYQWVQRGSSNRPPVIMLHGLGSTGEDWFIQYQSLEAERPVLTLDFPGHGKSPPLSDPISIDQLAEAVAALMADQSNEPFHLIGLSLGAVVGLELMVSQPERLRSAMLVNGFANYQPGGAERIGAFLRLLFLLLGRMDWVAWWVARSVFPGAEQAQFRRLAAERIASVDRRTYWYYLKALGDFDMRHALPNLQTPTLVVAGLKDRIVARPAKLELAENLPNSSLEEVPDSGHGTPIDAFQRFNPLMIDWIKANESN